MPGKVIVCLCHDVTEDDVRRAVAEGYDDIETVKRFTGAMMGPCQGKTCACALRDLVARLTGRGAEEQALPARRPPAFAARLGALSGGIDEEASAAAAAQGSAGPEAPRPAVVAFGCAAPDRSRVRSPDRPIAESFLGTASPARRRASCARPTTSS